MKIVVLDGHALNPGDLSWKALSAIGDLQVFDRTADDQIVARALSGRQRRRNRWPVRRYNGCS